MNSQPAEAEWHCEITMVCYPWSRVLLMAQPTCSPSLSKNQCRNSQFRGLFVVLKNKEASRYELLHELRFPPVACSFIFLIAVMIALPALGAYAQKRPGSDTFQKTSIKGPQPCSVETAGAVTYLVRNGVELSVNEDWD